MKEQKLLDEISETVERLWDNAPPKIVLDGWWWKRYIPFFRRQQAVVEEMWEIQWVEGGRDRHQYSMRKIKNDPL